MGGEIQDLCWRRVVSVASQMPAASVSVSGGVHVHAQRAKCYDTYQRREASVKSHYFVVSHIKCFTHLFFAPFSTPAVML